MAEKDEPTLDSIIANLIDDDWVSLTQAHWCPPGLELHFAVARPRGAAPRKRWKLFCKNLVNYSITDADGGGLNHFEDDHPALQFYLEPKGRIYLDSPVESTALVVGTLLVCHSWNSGGWIDPCDTLGTPSELADAIAAANEPIATGPKFLLDSYRNALEDLGISSRAVYDRARPPRMLHLVHFGTSFVICEGIGVEVLS